MYWDHSFGGDVVLIFGNEEEGVPQNFWDFKGLPKIHSCRIPTVSVRCLNLATSVGIMGFEVSRQWSKNRIGTEGAVSQR
jgi:tRNA(Leu) C34 or U34 (ribose-2'-O)-methylase TrmL